MSELNFAPRDGLADEYGYRHRLVSELARGGQGVVYRTSDPDIAVKQPLDSTGNPRDVLNLRDRFENIRCLPIPPRIPISLPVAVLRDEPGYVMKLLHEMEPFSQFQLNGKSRIQVDRLPTPEWLSGVAERSSVLTLMHYALSGSTKRRLSALAKVASILARLHSSGLVYGDVSPNNCFVSEGDSRDVWLIDADNLRFEREHGGNSVYTPRYGAPEIVQERDRSRPCTDAWAFATMAFETLTLLHPFVGRKVLDSEEDGGGWDSDSAGITSDGDIYAQAMSGFLSYVDHPYDRSNAAVGGLPRELVLTPGLAVLFDEMFVAGRTEPWRRPALVYWALELARAHDRSVVCPSCEMSYFLDLSSCPFCASDRPDVAVLSSQHWNLVVQEENRPVDLPHRLTEPFSLELHASPSFSAVIDFSSRTLIHERGTEPLPESLSLNFVGSKQ